eukprot:TRINITY_DN2579_c3_g1_i1.p1 TRINITY_DN2579_c3_g1~~TRINITY_DN2579_c3_g1_i1.p1  ORF type:complete len:545 (+),score=158.46 TRINITY_DN2579_c3_g1_i1:124-1635(+)
MPSPKAVRRRATAPPPPELGLPIPGLMPVGVMPAEAQSVLQPSLSTPLCDAPAMPEMPPDVKDARRAKSFLDDDDDDEQHFTRYNRDLFEAGELGQGSFAKVRKVWHGPMQQFVAVKQMNSPSWASLSRENVLREVGFLAVAGQHSNIVRYHDSWFEDGRLGIMFEYCEEGSLSSMSRDWSPAEVQSILQQVAQGLNLIHSIGFVHLDVKPDNILRTGDCYKLADFGLIRKSGGERKIDEEGDSRYLCLCLLRGGAQLEAADIFSLGATTYELARRRPLPCNGEEWQAIRTGCFPDDLADVEAVGHPPALCELLRRMMLPRPEDRPAAVDVCMHGLFRADAGADSEWSADQVAGRRREVEALSRRVAELERLVSLRNTRWAQAESPSDRSFSGAPTPPGRGGGELPSGPLDLDSDSSPTAAALPIRDDSCLPRRLYDDAPPSLSPLPPASPGSPRRMPCLSPPAMLSPQRQPLASLGRAVLHGGCSPPPVDPKRVAAARRALF